MTVSLRFTVFFLFFQLQEIDEIVYTSSSGIISIYLIA